MNGHGIHAKQQVRPKWFRKVTEPNLFIMLILKEVFDAVFEDTGLVIVFGDGVDLTLGVGPWPEALFQSADMSTMPLRLGDQQQKHRIC